MELWENVTLNAALPPHARGADARGGYLSSDPAAPDCTYVAEASVIEGYEFDRVAFRVVGKHLSVR